ncbi:hypothetical protein [Marinobacter sp. F3R08]|uniref:hypothetical protein n=1 Tax=Marinobacter sp. F3R08 TaxID=2841559 RepID=UPI001C0A38DC|nr:hypothetical protein [Marinobacter sp. F3R08]MBU2954755.1 hypothetical protein [Marinobacter sp. F3R08]
MHSSRLRGSDFQINWRGEPIRHADFFASFKETDRVGIVTPHRTEGLGAMNLIMACVTAFYDRYREKGAEFYAYPDFFTFQQETPCADYCMFDIWPYHKNVEVQNDPQKVVEAITERGITVLLVPEQADHETEILPVEMESAKRTIRQCFQYSETGKTMSADLAIECQSSPLRDYAMAVLDSLSEADAPPERRRQWEQRLAQDVICQTFRELDPVNALWRL